MNCNTLILLLLGGTASLFHDFMLYLSKQITIQLGMAPGGEFRAAYQEAKKINARVLLGDRSIKTTMKRAVNSSSLWTKFRLFYALLVGSGISDFTKEKVEEIKSCDLEDLMKQMESRFWKDFWKIIFLFIQYLLLSHYLVNFSGLNRVIVQERDIFLAYKIRQAIDVVRQDLVEADDSSANRQNPSVVAVVGLGHSAGIKEHWEKVTKDDIQRIVTIPEASKWVTDSNTSQFL